MRSSTKSESNCDNLNNNLDESTDKRSTDDVIDIADSECSHKLLNQAETELTDRIESADNDKSAKVNVYEQVRRIFQLKSLKT